ncbi:unannotated protein [freshwater metagenome]|uniref:Unannotated protein n=1 Tax=freshwater metagenome TaxID=449393 RepID=A0A6J6ARI0_9ZZZZ
MTDVANKVDADAAFETIEKVAVVAAFEVNAF